MLMLNNRYALAGKIALVTGGSRSIGRAIAIGLGRAGAHVAVNYLGAADDARSAVIEIEAAGARGLAVQADVMDPHAVRRMVDQVEAELLCFGEGGLERDHTQLLTFGTDDTELTSANTAVRTGVADGGLLRENVDRHVPAYREVQLLDSGQKNRHWWGPAWRRH